MKRKMRRDCWPVFCSKRANARATLSPVRWPRSLSLPPRWSLLAAVLSGLDVACGLGDNTIVVRDVEEGEVIGTMRGHGGAVHSLLWSDAKGWLLSGAADATIRVWRVRNDTA